MSEERLKQQLRFKKILQDSFVDAKEEIPEPPVAISKGRLPGGEYIPMGTYGNFSIIISFCLLRLTRCVCRRFKRL